MAIARQNPLLMMGVILGGFALTLLLTLGAHLALQALSHQVASSGATILTGTARATADGATVTIHAQQVAPGGLCNFKGYLNGAQLGGDNFYACTPDGYETVLKLLLKKGKITQAQYDVLKLMSPF